MQTQKQNYSITYHWSVVIPYYIICFGVYSPYTSPMCLSHARTITLEGNFYQTVLGVIYITFWLYNLCTVYSPLDLLLLCINKIVPKERIGRLKEIFVYILTCAVIMLIMALRLL